jgi:hypothetical protein
VPGGVSPEHRLENRLACYGAASVTVYSMKTASSQMSEGFAGTVQWALTKYV